MNDETKMENLTKWLNSQGRWISDYQEHKDNIWNYVELFEGHDLFYGEIDDEFSHKNVRKWLEKELDK